MMGKSRSATLVIAFLMSQDREATPESALKSIQTVRSIAEPNEGFMEQLWLYHRMGAPAEVDLEPAYQRWLFERSVRESVDCGRAPDQIRFEDEAHPLPGASPEREVRCRKCRRNLATSAYLVSHEPKSPSATQNALVAAVTEPMSDAESHHYKRHTVGASSQCAHLFLDPLSWMRPELEKGNLDGRLECPKCSTNVGKYAWQGSKCSCGAWVTPAISLSRSRVDEIRSRSLASAGGEQHGRVNQGLGGFGGKM